MSYGSCTNSILRHFCQGKLAEERKRVEKIVEQMPQRMIKKQQEEEKKNVEV